MLLHVTKWLEKRHLNFYHLKMRNTKDVNSEILFILANIKHSDDESSSSHQSESTWQTDTNLSLPPTISGINNIPVVFEESVPVQHQHIQEWDNVGDNRTIFQNENRNASTLHKQLIVFRNIECLLAEQTVQMNSIEQRLERIENIVAGKFDGLTNTAQDDSVLTTLLPLNSLEGLNTFDILLSTHVDMALKFKTKLKRIGAQNPRESVQRIGSKVFTNALLINCSWKGRANNFKLCDLKVIQIIKSKLKKMKDSELILTSSIVLDMFAAYIFVFYIKFRC